jgi:hypothetical protein
MMNGNRRFLLLLITFLTIAVLGLAGDERQAARVRPESNVPQTSVQAQTLDPGSRVQAAPQLEPEVAAIEASFGQQIQMLSSEFASAQTEDEREAVQQRVQSLKIEWTLALANRQLELARQKQDAKAEAEILQMIAHITNRVAPALTPIPRDPQTGAAIEGGAR